MIKFTDTERSVILGLLDSVMVAGLARNTRHERAYLRTAGTARAKLR